MTLEKLLKDLRIYIAANPKLTKTELAERIGDVSRSELTQWHAVVRDPATHAARNGAEVVTGLPICTGITEPSTFGEGPVIRPKHGTNQKVMGDSLC